MTTRLVLAGIVAVFVGGCAEVAKKDLDDLEARIGAKIAQSVAEMDTKINATDAKYANMLALEQKVKNGVDAIDKNAQLLQKSGEAMLQILQSYRNLLREQLKSVDDQIASLKPAE